MINGGGDKVLAFLQKMKALMEMERQDEMDESASLLSEFSFKDLEKRNMAITKLMIKEVSTGIYGRVLLHLSRQKKEQVAPTDDDGAKLRRFSPGDIVGIYQSGEKTDEKAEGIIYKVHHDEIIVSFNEMYDFENFKQPLNLALLANQVTYKRCQVALDHIIGMSNKLNVLNQRIIDVLFEKEKPISYNLN